VSTRRTSVAAKGAGTASQPVPASESENPPETPEAGREAPEGRPEAPTGLAPAMVPAVREQTGALPAPSSMRERLATYRTLGWWIANAEGTATPQAGSAGALRFFYAEALELPPLAAQELWIDQRGKLNVSVKLLRAVAEMRGYLVRPVEWTDQACTAVLLVDGEELGRYTFTIEQARRAGLVKDRSAWVTFPERMLFARAAGFLLNTYAPGLMLGMETADELETADVPWRGSGPPYSATDFHGDHEPEMDDEDRRLASAADDDIPF